MVSLRNLSKDLRKTWFPQLTDDNFTVTSPPSEAYNCIAWTANDSTRKWDPSDIAGRFWPDGLRRDFDLPCFIELYRLMGGYTPCDHGNPESGYEKIAIYVGDDQEVKHTARQLPSGRWTSKLGDFEDIEHSLPALEGGGYGFTKQFLKPPV